MMDVLGPPRANLLDGLALRAYDSGHAAALRAIARYGIAYHPDVDDLFERWQTDDTRRAGGWYSQGWDDTYARHMNEVEASA
jgi:hypothetical protein